MSKAPGDSAAGGLRAAHAVGAGAAAALAVFLPLAAGFLEALAVFFLAAFFGAALAAFLAVFFGAFLAVVLPAFLAAFFAVFFGADALEFVLVLMLFSICVRPRRIGSDSTHDPQLVQRVRDDFQRRIFYVTDSEHRTSSKRLPTGNDVVRRTCCPRDELEDITLERGIDSLPLRFTGRLVGSNTVDLDLPRGTEVRVFVTRASNIVTWVRQWQRGRGAVRERYAAAVHTTGAEALAWLVADGRGQLGSASCEAWRMACASWPTLEGHDVERVD